MIDAFQIIKIALNLPRDLANLLLLLPDHAGIGVHNAEPFMVGIILYSDSAPSFDPYDSGSMGSVAWQLGFQAGINHHPIDEIDLGQALTSRPFMLGYEYGLMFSLNNS